MATLSERSQFRGAYLLYIQQVIFYGIFLANLRCITNKHDLTLLFLENSLFFFHQVSLNTLFYIRPMKFVSFGIFPEELLLGQNQACESSQYCQLLERKILNLYL